MQSEITARFILKKRFILLDVTGEMVNNVAFSLIKTYPRIGNSKAAIGNKTANQV